MRLVLAWLVALGVIAGLSARALPTYLAEGHAHEHSHAGSVEPAGACHHHDHGHPAPVEGDPDESGHPCDDPHHHHGCCAPVTISADGVREWRLTPPGGVLLGHSEHREPVPDEPYLEREAPPLI